MEDATPVPAAEGGDTAGLKRSAPALETLSKHKKQASLGGLFSRITAAEHSACKEDQLREARAQGPVVKRPSVASP